MLEADWDLGMVNVAMMGGANREGEFNGSDP